MDIQKTLNNCDKVNTLLNILACGGSICFFGLNPFALGLSYIGSDIIFMGLDVLMQKHIIKKSLLSKENISDLKDFLQESMKNNVKNESQYNKFKNMYQNLNKQIEYEIIKEQETVEKLKKEEEDFKKKQIKNYDFTINIFESFNHQYSELDTLYKNKLENISILLTEIKNLIEKNPIATSKISYSFELYMNEIFNVIEKLTTITSSDKDDLNDKFNKVISQFEIYLKNIKYNIINIDTNVDVSINVLLKNLEKLNKTEE